MCVEDLLYRWNGLAYMMKVYVPLRGPGMLLNGFPELRVAPPGAAHVSDASCAPANNGRGKLAPAFWLAHKVCARRQSAATQVQVGPFTSPSRARFDGCST